MRLTLTCEKCGKRAATLARNGALGAKKLKWTCTLTGFICSDCQPPKTAKGKAHIPANKKQADGYTFDSGDEYDYYCLLKKRVLSGEIRDLDVHPKFDVQTAYTDRWGRKYRAITLTMDFAYTVVTTGERWVDDMKGWKGNDRGKALLPIVQRMYPEFRFRWCDKKGNDWLSPAQKKRQKEKAKSRPRQKLL